MTLAARRHFCIGMRISQPNLAEATRLHSGCELAILLACTAPNINRTRGVRVMSPLAPEVVGMIHYGLWFSRFLPTRLGSSGSRTWTISSGSWRTALLADRLVFSTQITATSAILNSSRSEHHEWFRLHRMAHLATMFLSILLRGRRCSTISKPEGMLRLFQCGIL